MAVDGAHLDGSAVNQSHIVGATFPCGVVVDARTSPSSPLSNQFSLGKPRLNKRHGTAMLPVSVPGAGKLGLASKGVVAARAVRVTAVGAPAAVRLPIAARGAKQRQLNRSGKVTGNPKVTYTPDGGDPSIRSTKLRLRKR